MHPHDDFAQEPIRGLPEHLPPGERILWQGEPHWPSLARRAFHTRKVAIYFGILAVWQGLSSWSDGDTLANAGINMLWMLALALAAIGILTLLAWLYSRSSVFTITDKRLVMRFGIALPMSLNIPFKLIESANLKTFADGCGDIPVRLIGKNRIALLILWPFARPWRATKPEPMLRSIPESENVARILAHALASNANTTAWQAENKTAITHSSTPNSLATMAR